MLKTSLSTLILLIAISVFGQETETRSLEDFDEISVSGNIDVTLLAGDKNSAEISLEGTTMDDLIMDVKGDRLVIKFKKKNWNWKKKRKAEIDLYFTDLDAVSVSAGSSLIGNTKLEVERFKIDASSGASTKLKLDTDELKVDLSSGAEVKTSGYADNLSVDISSGAMYYGNKLEARHVDVDASSGGTAKVWSTQSITAEASSGGKVKYKGDPENTDIDSGFSGSIKKVSSKKKSTRKS